MSNLIVIVPSRGRPGNIKELAQAFADTKASAELLVVLDDDDPTLNDYLSLEGDFSFLTLPREGRGMAKPLNFAARKVINDYDHFAFMGDDHRPRTIDWDKSIVDVLDEIGTGLVYGNDLLQGKNLPTAVAMTGNIVRALEGMVPPGMIHLYLDNFWMTLGQDLHSLHYLEEVIIEHLHPIAGKAEWDQGYRDVNAEEIYSADAIAFSTYIQSQAYRDLIAQLT